MKSSCTTSMGFSSEFVLFDISTYILQFHSITSGIIHHSNPCQWSWLRKRQSQPCCSARRLQQNRPWGILITFYFLALMTFELISEPYKGAFQILFCRFFPEGFFHGSYPKIHKIISAKPQKGTFWPKNTLIALFSLVTCSGPFLVYL